MKSKHLAARVQQCLAIASCSSCCRRQFGAVLFDPVRNTDAASGYNGPIRGAQGDLCGGDFCVRNGLGPDDLVVADHTGFPLHHPQAEKDAGVDDDTAYLLRFGRRIEVRPGSGTWRGWRNEAELRRDELLVEFPPIASGEKIEQGCVHAEQNVLCNAAASGVRTAGLWLVVTGEPCLMCAKLLVQAGITKVFCVRGGYKGGGAGPALLQQHGVPVEYVDGPQDPRLEEET